MAKSPKGLSVMAPNLGMYLDRPPIMIPERGLKDCMNIRIHNKAIERRNIGYGPFPDGAAQPLNLDNKPVTLIDNFFPRAGGQYLLLANTTDIFLFDESTSTVNYLSMRYETGTVDVTNGSPTVTGTGTSWLSELKAGDFMHVGAAGQNDPTATWYEISSVDSDTQVTLVSNYAEATASGQAYTARKTFTGDAQDYWETTIFFSGTNLTQGADGDRWYATNGIDEPVAWEANASQVYEPDFGNIKTCRSFAVTKNILMLINLSLTTGENRPFSVRTSAIGEPENMVTLEASEFVAHDGADPLTTAFAIGESVAIYGERSITLTQFVGPPTVFVFRNVMNGVGPRAGRAIADFGDYHEIVASDSMYIFDGIGIQEVNSHVWQEMIRRTSPQRFNYVSSHFDEERGDLIWVLPLNSDPDPDDGPPTRAIVEHYLEDAGRDADHDIYTQREIPATSFGFFSRETTLTFDQIASAWEDQNYRWDDQFFQGAFPFNLFGDINGNVFILSTKDSANGEEMVSYARFGRRPLGNLRNKGVLKRIYPLVETLASSSHDLTVRVHTTDLPGGNTSLEFTQGYPMTQEGNHFLSPRIAARYAELEFRTATAGHIWTLLGYDMEVVPGGER